VPLHSALAAVASRRPFDEPWLADEADLRLVLQSVLPWE
jgi:hypothetical protein